MAATFGARIAEAAAAAGLAVGSVISSGPLPAMHPSRAVRSGDRLRLEMRDAHGRSVFGAIEHAIVPAAA